MIKWDLRAVMARQNVTQTQLAKEMGVNRSTVKSWYDRDEMPSFQDAAKTLDRLCKVLRCKLSDLMFYVEDETE